MARLGGCGYLGMTIILVVALVCFAFSTTSCTAAEAEVINEVINKTGAGLETGLDLPVYGPSKYGPWGYNPFTSFDHSGYDGIKSIKIRHGAIIDGIQVTYVKNGQTIETPAVGGSGGTLTEIHLNYPDEYIFTIWGIAGPMSYSAAAISRLHIYTNQNRDSYGPFGTERGGSDWQAFDARAGTGNPIRGLFGEAISHKYLASIGVYGDA